MMDCLREIEILLPPFQNDCPTPRSFITNIFWDRKLWGVGQSFWDEGSIMLLDHIYVKLGVG